MGAAKQGFGSGKLCVTDTNSRSLVPSVWHVGDAQFCSFFFFFFAMCTYVPLSTLLSLTNKKRVHY